MTNDHTVTHITTEEEVTNPHQPLREGSFLRCAAPDCTYALFAQYNFTIHGGYWEEHFAREHASQYEPGRAPDITVEWELVASCSVCEDGIGDVETVDSETIHCKDCGTTWDDRGCHGERAEEL